MTARVPASDQTRKQLADLVSGAFDQSARLRNAVRVIIEEALEAEVTDALGREYSQRGESAGYRNGNRFGRLKTAEGIVEYAVPPVPGTAEPWASAVQQALSGRTEALERLVVERYARGWSMRALAAAFTGAAGRCVWTNSAASPVTERWGEADVAFAGRDLAGPPIRYRCLEGVAERLPLGQPRAPVLAAWGMAAAGANLLRGLYAASQEDAASAREGLRALQARGMNAPVRVATEGAPGLIRAVEEVFPPRLRQRCWAHTLRHRGAKAPAERWREGKAHARAAYQARSPLAARAAAEAFRRRYARQFPRAVACLADEFEACIAPCACPSLTARRFGPPTGWSGWSARNAAALKPFPTPAANGRC